MADATSKRGSHGFLSDEVLATGLDLYPYQIEAVNFLRARPRAILADTMGLGKTAESLVAAEARGALKILVVCPKSLNTISRAS
jgi:SNF2 family DNA or RNA helicase